MHLINEKLSIVQFCTSYSLDLGHFIFALISLNVAETRVWAGNRVTAWANFRLFGVRQLWAVFYNFNI
jgi:hypothetical protein